MMDPINLLRIEQLKPLLKETTQEGSHTSSSAASVPPSTVTLPSLKLTRKALPARLNPLPQNMGMITPHFNLPNAGILHIQFSLYRTRYDIQLKLSANQQTECLPLATGLNHNGELWLTRQPGNTYQLVWLTSNEPIPVLPYSLSLAVHPITAEEHSEILVFIRQHPLWTALLISLPVLCYLFWKN
ncbi:MAG: hypothetical protein ACRDCQ_01065 [Aeromonas sobria]